MEPGSIASSMARARSISLRISPSPQDPKDYRVEASANLVLLSKPHEYWRWLVIGPLIPISKRKCGPRPPTRIDRGPHGSDSCIVPLDASQFKHLMSALTSSNGGRLVVAERMDGARFA